MASLLPDLGKHQTTPLTLSNTQTMPTPMATPKPRNTVIVHRNGVPTAIQATIPAIPTLGKCHSHPTSPAATGSSSKQASSPADYAPPHEYTPSTRPAPSAVQPTTAPASAPEPACPTPAAPPPNMTPPHVTLWTNTYLSHAHYPSSSHDTPPCSLVPTHRDIPLHNPVPSPSSPPVGQSRTTPTDTHILGTHRPTSSKMQHPESNPTEQGVADHTIDDDDQEEYDANTALQFPGIRNLHDEGQPNLYRTMQRYWEREAHLFQCFTADDIADVERQFADAKVRIQFSINPSLQHPDDQLSILNYRREIEDICQEHFGLTFRGDLLEHGQQHLGDPLQRTIQVMIFQYAGVLDNGLSFHQLEYRNPSKISPGDLMVALRALGATDAIVQSYSDVRNTCPSRPLGAIGCINWLSEGQYRFRLVFLSQSMAETIYANFRGHTAGPNRLDLATSAATLVDTKFRIARLPTPDVDITGDGYATLTFDTPAPVAFLWSTSGPHGETRLYIRDIAVHLHILTGRPAWSTLRPLHLSTPRRYLRSPDTRTRSTSRHRHAGRHTRSVPLHSATEGPQHQSQAWQLPLQRHPHQAPGHTTYLNLYLRRELSTYVNQRILSATTPLRQEVESLRADKEALAALVSASSAAFTTREARLHEERRLREAAELLQAEENRLRAVAHIRLNTAVTQYESQQAALAARLPYLESNIHTLLQAMQSVSSEMSALAGLGPLPATLPPNVPG
ncbi:hypothetical protein H257_15130 [Aphanomyces astaci]|uniref:Uncharacterized protein n=1 Tax=Aphanomyces astaci TaxID=112090 RepID=W4FQM3_APHAT|nr:hypothetical protein H257_15130 [Aphanomyces astaci]ETV68973.1 hypothetical protein H257_15130 [Aphanomyces astaci]|eukprot:XP_009841432.1 hypothetical protein H257_15130 [Aphanomyces astaci]